MHRYSGKIMIEGDWQAAHLVSIAVPSCRSLPVAVFAAGQFQFAFGLTVVSFRFSSIAVRFPIGVVRRSAVSRAWNRRSAMRRSLNWFRS
ncbi:MAG: hypothetical protein A3I66_10440 [Burkholderiales bacterium RIFCSPLOWO2_02_FULL_57_36]|nr:MAG: hypothetical protein A3I66_10440 [Burkholderiales bacterium RIFCSPLOWO2_02_FULL_57_36]